jgi:hypothetical protein
VEYWEKNNLVVALNGYIVYDSINPLPIEKHPYVVINYEINTGFMLSSGIGVTQADNQRFIDRVYNDYMDALTMAIAPMYQVERGAYKFDNDNPVLYYEPYKINEVRGQGRLERMNMVDLGAFNTAIASTDFLFRLGDQTTMQNTYGRG